jgi:TRAP-type C4-dicarboxylate transport system permease small subunit
MRKVISAIEQISRFAAGIAFAVLMAAVIIQVLGRSVFSNSPVWTEELTRFGLLYLVAFGVGLSYRSGDLVNVDMICEWLPEPWPRRLRFVSASATALLCAMLLGPAWSFASIGALQTSPALLWRMDFIYVSILLLLTLLLVFSLLRAVLMLLGQSDGHSNAQLGDSK